MSGNIVFDTPPFRPGTYMVDNPFVDEGYTVVEVKDDGTYANYLSQHVVEHTVELGKSEENNA